MEGGGRYRSAGKRFRLNKICVAISFLCCNSIDCGHGYACITDASSTACTDNECKESQCCQQVCSSYRCRGRYYQVDNADTLVCEDSGCTKSLCCETDGETHPRSFFHPVVLFFCLFCMWHSLHLVSPRQKNIKRYFGTYTYHVPLTESCCLSLLT